MEGNAEEPLEAPKGVALKWTLPVSVQGGLEDSLEVALGTLAESLEETLEEFPEGALEPVERRLEESEKGTLAEALELVLLAEGAVFNA